MAKAGSLSGYTAPIDKGGKHPTQKAEPKMASRAGYKKSSGGRMRGRGR